ncbi:MAG: alpha/beta hydrolase [Robiginitomaculum sp.]|nr:MAG: alpha/beta hydrolase [Robiginitomaculum sp.]
MYKYGLLISATIFIAMTGCNEKQPVITDGMPQTEAETHEQYIAVDGLRIRYKIEGENGKPVLVLVHGFTSSLEGWDGLTAALKDDYQIVRFDLAGHGLTGPDKQKRYGHTARVKTVRNLIDKLGYEKPNLIGSSMGGNIAWRYASTYPNDVNKLVLIDASGFPLNELKDTPLELPPMLKNYFLKPTKFAVNYGLKNQYYDTKNIPAGRADKILEMMKYPGNGQAYVDMFKIFTLPDPSNDLAKITAPTLIIWGSDDAVISSTHAELFKAALPNAEINIIADTGHVPHEENPTKTAKVIASFLTK